VNGKTLWVIGASTGIGAEITLQLAEAGNFVIASARDEKALLQLSLQHPSNIKILAFDLTAPERFSSVQRSLFSLTDYLDGIIFSAGICEYETSLEFNYAQYQRVMQVNFLGLIAVLNMAKPLIKNAIHPAQLCVVSSLATITPFPQNEIYGASKAALDYFVGALRCDSVHLPLDITWVRPGFVTTRLTAKNDFSMPFLMDAKSAAAKIVSGFLARKKTIIFPRRFYVLLCVMALFQTILPNLTARLLTRTKKW
jgi:short-subunit dehydrogenase